MLISFNLLLSSFGELQKKYVPDGEVNNFSDEKFQKKYPGNLRLGILLKNYLNKTLVLRLLYYQIIRQKLNHTRADC